MKSQLKMNVKLLVYIGKRILPCQMPDFLYEKQDDEITLKKQQQHKKQNTDENSNATGILPKQRKVSNVTVTFYQKLRKT